MPDLIIGNPEDDQFLDHELRRCKNVSHYSRIGMALFSTSWLVGRITPNPLPVRLAFSKQLLPDAAQHQANSITTWATTILECLTRSLPNNCPWRFHIFSRFNGGVGGSNRCQLIETTLTEKLQRLDRHRLKGMVESSKPFEKGEGLVQVMLVDPFQGWISVSGPDQVDSNPHLISKWCEGRSPLAVDKLAPSRAFSKLLEAEIRMRCRIKKNEVCVDLGACPGSWSYVALRRGAKVIAVDRSPLRQDLMTHRNLIFVPGDAFNFVPQKPVDWLLCDVIATPEKIVSLLSRWLENSWTRQFIVTIKFKGTEGYEIIEGIKEMLMALCSEFLVTKLSANKNEVTTMGFLR